MNKFVRLIFFLMVLIIVFISFFIFKRKNNKKIYKITNKDKVSVIILNYKRPHNLKKLIPKLLAYPIIDDILISNGLEGKEFEFFNKRVKIMNDFKMNKFYGAAIRFLKVKHVKNDIVLFIDDDIIPSEDLVNKLYFNVKNNYNRNTIYGPFASFCNSKGISLFYHLKALINSIKNIFYIKYDRWSYNSVLTGILMCKASIINDYLKSDEGWFKYKDWFKKYKGNCEDLSLNKFIESYYNEKPEHVSGKYKLLDVSNGYSTTKWFEFAKIRDDFCKKYSTK